MKVPDDRNYEVTNEIYQILDKFKGFEAAMSNPRIGRIIIRRNGVSFLIDISPIYRNDFDETTIGSFQEICKDNNFLFIYK